MPLRAAGAAAAGRIRIRNVLGFKQFHFKEIRKRMKQPDNNPVAKKLYEPPKIVIINLRPEEAVLGNCKISGSSGPGSTSCSVLHCSTIGS
jgi:hypothetical protein